jgi:AcrR family transcriptional regulator
VQQRSQETRNKILETATDLFSKSGYDATGVAEICQAAGVSKGAFYHHFPTKQALFIDLLDSYLNSLETGFSQMRQQGQVVPHVIIEMAEMAGSLFQSADIHLPIFLEFWTQANHDNQIWQTAISPYRRFQEYFAELIQEGINEGSLQAIDPQLAARVLVSMAIGMLMQSMFDPEITNWQDEARQSMQLLINGIARRKP